MGSRKRSARRRGNGSGRGEGRLRAAERQEGQWWDSRPWGETSSRVGPLSPKMSVSTREQLTGSRDGTAQHVVSRRLAVRIWRALMDQGQGACRLATAGPWHEAHRPLSRKRHKGADVGVTWPWGPVSASQDRLSVFGQTADPCCASYPTCNETEEGLEVFPKVSSGHRIPWF